MSQDQYLRMMERMNQNEAKHPPTQAMLNVLKELFTEEQAALVGDFPLGAYSARAWPISLVGTRANSRRCWNKCLPMG